MGQHGYINFDNSPLKQLFNICAALTSDLAETLGVIPAAGIVVVAVGIIGLAGRFYLKTCALESENAALERERARLIENMPSPT